MFDEPWPRGSSDERWPPRGPGSGTIEQPVRPSPLIGKALDGPDMHYLGVLFLLLAVATDAGCASSQRCPAVVKSLAAATTFSTLTGTVGCVTPTADAFLILYEARDIEGLRTLARSDGAGAQLFALCGFKHLHAEADETSLRTKLLLSQQEALAVFDLQCDYLIEQGRKPYRRPCDTESGRPTCR
jgi:hypothetical protein